MDGFGVARTEHCAVLEPSYVSARFESKASAKAEDRALLRSLVRSHESLAARARAAFTRHPAVGSAAFHGAAPLLAPFLLYRLPSVLREAGAYTPTELESLVDQDEGHWITATLLRHHAIYAAAHFAADALEAGALPTSSFLTAIRRTVGLLAAIDVPALAIDQWRSSE